ncbi:MAG: hypothetical protein ACLFNN_01650 [Candidatus Paceibacterota bacterium]
MLRAKYVFKVFLVSVTPFLLFGVVMNNAFYLEASTDLDIVRSLSLGDSGSDVKKLQIFLNSDSETQLANSGLGSSGQETEYFGPLTKNAVISFQEKHASDVLRPLGLSRGTGYFGPSTKAKVKELTKRSGSEDSVDEKNDDEKNRSEKEDDETSTGSEDVEEDPNNQNDEAGDDISEDALDEEDLKEGFDWMHTDELMLTQPSRYSGKRGERLDLHGFGFSDNNTVHFGDDLSLKNIEAQGESLISLEVPDEISSGYHDIMVENDKGITEDSQVFFVVLDDDSNPPVIESVEPESGGWGTEITVYGSNFDEDWNMVRTPFGIFEGITSKDGETITFKIEDPYSYDVEEVEKIMQELGEDTEVVNVNDIDEDHGGEAEEEMSIHFQVVNDEGIDNENGEFRLDL